MQLCQLESQFFEICDCCMIRVNFALELIKWWYSCIRVLIGHDGFCESTRGNGIINQYRASVHNESLTLRDD